MRIDLAGILGRLAGLFALLVLVVGCTTVQVNKVDPNRFDIYSVGFGDNKAKVLLEANLKCGERGVEIEELHCGGICTHGKVKCVPGTASAVKAEGGTAP